MARTMQPDFTVALRERDCGACADGIAPPFRFTMAYQPVVDLAARRVYAYEALVRGPAGQGAGSVLGQVTPQNRYAFDQSCRIKAIELASRLKLPESGAGLSINFIPGAMYSPENCVRATLAVAKRCDFPVDRLIFEMTENEEITDHALMDSIFRVYQANRFRTALDDFGAGYSGLNLLARFPFDVVKIDMMVLRSLDTDDRRRAIVQGIVGICRDLGAKVVAGGGGDRSRARRPASSGDHAVPGLPVRQARLRDAAGGGFLAAGVAPGVVRTRTSVQASMQRAARGVLTASR